MCMRVRINVVGVVLSINDRRKRVSGRGLCEPFTKTNFADGRPPTSQHNNTLDSGDDDLSLSNFISLNMLFVCYITIHDMICAPLYVHCSVLLQMRHSGVDASEHTAFWY